MNCVFVGAGSKAMISFYSADREEESNCRVRRIGIRSTKTEDCQKLILQLCRLMRLASKCISIRILLMAVMTLMTPT